MVFVEKNGYQARFGRPGDSESPDETAKFIYEDVLEANNLVPRAILKN